MNLLRLGEFRYLLLLTCLYASMMSTLGTLFAAEKIATPSAGIGGDTVSGDGNISSAIVRILDSQGIDANPMPPEIEADILLTAVEAGLPNERAEKLRAMAQADPDSKLTNDDSQSHDRKKSKETKPEKLTVLDKDMLARIARLLPKIQKIFPTEVAPYRTDVLEHPTSTLARMTLQARLSQLREKQSKRQGFDDLLNAMNVPFPRLLCGTSIGQTDSQMHEWLLSLAQSAENPNEQMGFLIRAITNAKSPYAIAVYARALASYDLNSAYGRQLLSAFTAMLSRISVDRFINGRIFLTDVSALRSLVDRYGNQSEIGRSLIAAANDYISRRVSAGYCDEFISSSQYGLEVRFFTDALPNSGFKPIALDSFPPPTFQTLTREDVQRNYEKIFSTNLGKALAGPRPGSVRNTSDLISFIDQLIPGAEGFAKRHFVNLLVYDWVEQNRPTPPAVPGMMRAFAILNDNTYWNGDTENWRNAAREYFQHINMADESVRNVLIDLAQSSKHKGVRLYALLAKDNRGTNPTLFELGREAEKNQKAKQSETIQE